jgi:hypothetical protein
VLQGNNREKIKMTSTTATTRPLDKIAAEIRRNRPAPTTEPDVIDLTEVDGVWQVPAPETGSGEARQVALAATDDPLDQAADEIAAELIRMAQESPDGLAFLDRVMDRIAQTRYITISPVREV